MKPMSYVVYREEEFFVAQCLNVDVSSFGDSREAAVVNLKEAVELYFAGETESVFSTVTDLNVGEEMVNA
jgi:predicted RNase H-like HicB family nuclease